MTSLIPFSALVEDASELIIHTLSVFEKIVDAPECQLYPELTYYHVISARSELSSHFLDIATPLSSFLEVPRIIDPVSLYLTSLRIARLYCAALRIAHYMNEKPALGFAMTSFFPSLQKPSTPHIALSLHYDNITLLMSSIDLPVDLSPQLTSSRLITGPLPSQWLQWSLFAKTPFSLPGLSSLVPLERQQLAKSYLPFNEISDACFHRVGAHRSEFGWLPPPGNTVNELLEYVRFLDSLSLRERRH